MVSPATLATMIINESVALSPDGDETSTPPRRANLQGSGGGDIFVPGRHKIELLTGIEWGKGIHRTGGVGTGGGLKRVDFNFVRLNFLFNALRIGSETHNFNIHAGPSGSVGMSWAPGDLVDIENAPIMKITYGALVALGYGYTDLAYVGLKTGFEMVMRSAVEGENDNRLNDTGSFIPYEHEFGDAFGGPGDVVAQIPLKLSGRLGPVVVEGGVNFHKAEYKRTDGPARAYFEMPDYTSGVNLGVDFCQVPGLKDTVVCK